MNVRHRFRCVAAPALCICTIMMLLAQHAHARVGMGDPSAPWRDKEPDDQVVWHGHLRLRGALYGNLDLDRAPSSDGSSLWSSSGSPGDITAGSDLRVRLAPSFFIGDTGRIALEIDALDNVALGARPRFTPFGDATGLVVGAPFAEPISALEGAFRVRTAMAEVLLPFGVLSVGRQPSHFGLGIAANAGDDLDDDGGDRADRIAFVSPLLGHFAALAWDLGASGPSSSSRGLGPLPHDPRVSKQAIAAALLRFHAPWEVKAYTVDDGSLLDYGVSAAYEWQDLDAPAYWQTLDPSFALTPDAIVVRGYKAGVVDGWFRLVTAAWRVELEATGSYFTIANPSPYAGVVVREPVSGAPWSAVALAQWQLRADTSLLGEVGAASSDPAPGLPLPSPTSFVGARPGDVYGPQIDGTRDSRQDASRIQPLHRVDLILWRTLLGGVSEAAYGRAQLRTSPIDDVTLEAGAIYSHALDPASAPGGVAPLGVELDGALSWRIDALQLRVDGGVLFPLGGLGARGGAAATVASMGLVRLGYAF